ncbi:MAG: acyl-CoA thioesterase [Cellulomonas sp.]|jgi:YbgC/YbaW family acyl-CoA thioester hydrolase|uniref:acyl-CoA thioesterase n=1 Tax=Cellulomonas sp. TaxID=40001 RepID=UPI001A01DDD4|nr:acyl-CoA thioesterase [Cellulomonas sp.]MBF0687017.1 acyl-CoA thioesterase [Cellulomonas sp.]
MLQLALVTLRPRPAVAGRDLLDPSVTHLRVRLGDLDLYRHVNNGVYLQYMDLGRSNYLADLGAFGRLSARGWYPVVAASTVTYRRSLTLGQRFTVTSRVLGWDGRVVYLEQVVERDGQLVARGWVAGRFLSRAGDRIAPADVVSAIDGGTRESPALPEDLATWARAVDVAHR